MLQGATYWFIRHALSYSVHDMDNAGPYILDSHSTPLFSRLSLSHRLALLAELAEGLLVPDTPLPPDTLEHHAAFLYLYCFALHIIEGSDLDGIGLSEEEEMRRCKQGMDAPARAAHACLGPPCSGWKAGVEGLGWAGRGAVVWQRDAARCRPRSLLATAPLMLQEDMEASEEDEEEEDLGELGEDKSAEMAAQLRRLARAGSRARGREQGWSPPLGGTHPA